MYRKLITAAAAVASLTGATLATTSSAFAWGESYYSPGYSAGYVQVYHPVQHKVCHRVVTYDRYGHPCYEVVCHFE